MLQKKGSKNLTEGNITKLMISFALPILFGNLFQQLYNFTDLLIVSHKVGLSALEGVGATASLTSLVICFVNGLTNGFCIITAQNFGAKNETEVRRSVAATITLSFFFTIILSIGSLFIIRKVLHILNTPDNVMDDAYNYISILLMGLVFTMAYNMLANILRALGNSITPLIFLGISTILNIGMDLLFICVFQMGIRGAALATVLAQCISSILCLLYIMKNCPEIHLSKNDFSFNKNLLSKMLSTGFSMAMMLSIVGMGSVILQSGINGLGEITIAAHICARKVMEFFMMPIAVIGSACATFSSQNYGAGRLDRVFEGTKKGFQLGFLWSTISTAILVPFAPFFIRMIIDKQYMNNTALIDTAVGYLRISVPCFYALIILIVLRNVLQGIGKRIVPILVSATELIGKIIAIRILVPTFGYFGVCITEPIIWIVDGIFVLVVYWNFRRKSALKG